MRRAAAQLIRFLRGTLASAILGAGLCMLAPFCGGTGSLGSLTQSLLFVSDPAVHTALAGTHGHSGASAWATSHEGDACDAVLTDPRQTRIVQAPMRRRPRGTLSALFRFHNNSRPVILRDRAIYCDFTLLRSVLHPQFVLIAHTSAVLC